MPFNRARIVLTGIFCLALALSGCSSPVNSTDTAESTLVPSVTSVPSPTSTVTPVPRSLVVCLGQEPSSLYLYGDSSRSAWSVREAIYDGPFDTRNFQAQPVILQKLPAYADGDALIEVMDVVEGDAVVDLEGNLVALAQGVMVKPAGCTSSDCVITWEGGPLQMERLSLTFSLLEDVVWSDGTPLTAQDSVYSFQLSADPDTQVSKNIIYRTYSYEALDEQTVQWVGIPGYFPERFESVFWIPLPQHAWESIAPIELATREESSRMPMGWGAYMIQEWVEGDHITLVKNPYYFRASEGLPAFDYLVYRFLGEAGDNNLAALLSGECDLVDRTSMLDEQLEAILQLQGTGELAAFIGQGPDWEHVDFGIVPASLDDGYYWISEERPDLFGDVRVRQAFAYCMDRQGIVDELMLGQSSVPAGFYPPTHPLYAQNLTALPYDPTAGRSLLDQVGWKDWDGDPDTPLQSSGIPNVPDGTSLSVNYYTSEAELRVAVAERLVQSMSECGIQVNVMYMDTGQLFAAGPDGLLFGRNFDLAEFSWKMGSQPFCAYYTTGQIPSEANNWLAVNLTGYSSVEYDAACQSAQQSRADQSSYMESNLEVQSIFANDLPAVPLYFRLQIAVARPDICGFEMDVSARSDLWDIESLDYGEGCP